MRFIQISQILNRSSSFSLDYVMLSESGNEMATQKRKSAKVLATFLLPSPISSITTLGHVFSSSGAHFNCLLGNIVATTEAKEANTLARTAAATSVSAVRVPISSVAKVASGRTKPRRKPRPPEPPAPPPPVALTRSVQRMQKSCEKVLRNCADMRQ
ncbi:hypothetical protein TYRP_004934 [Tyrophagus putrescentiae]|nr:hypothetical protein TYRP_004934 [Tyrophagus putrescentiae]